MRLVDRSSNHTVAQYDGSQVTFPKDSALKSVMESRGIYIPPVARHDEFAGRTYVEIKDGDLFAKAFMEIYYIFTMNNDIYTWKED